MDAHDPPQSGHAAADPVAAPEEGERQRVTDVLLRIGSSDGAGYEQLLPLVYEDLHRIARRQLRRERTGHTLSTTALVHEAYLRLVDQTRARWENRAQFFAVAARAMRRILVDHARRTHAAKRGGGLAPIDVDDVEIAIEERSEELIALDEALTKLAEVSPRLAQVVECRFFGGMTEEETAAALGLTDRTVRRDWVKAKGWLHGALRGT